MIFSRVFYVEVVLGLADGNVHLNMFFMPRQTFLSSSANLQEWISADSWFVHAVSHIILCISEKVRTAEVPMRPRFVDVGALVHKLVIARVRSQCVEIVVVRMGDALMSRPTARKRRHSLDTTWRNTWSHSGSRFVKASALPRISCFRAVRM